VTLIRLTGQLLDDERSCVVDGCDSLAAAEPYQVELPEREAELRRKAEAYERLATEARDQAEAVRAEIDGAKPRPFLCGGHRQQLPRNFRGPWEAVPSLISGMPVAGRLVVQPGCEANAIAATLAALEANPIHYREPQPDPPQTVRRLPHRATV
jgi:hypothetical protein